MADNYINLPVEGGGGGGGAVDDVNGVTGSVNIVAGSGIGVSVFGQNITISNSGALTFPIVAPSGTAGAPSYAFSESGNDTGIYSQGDGDISFSNDGVLGMSLDPSHNLTVVGNITAANYPPTGNFDSVAGFDGTGVFQSIPNWGILNDLGIYTTPTYQPNGLTQYTNSNSMQITVDPLQNSPAESVAVINMNTNIDPNSSGFQIGTDGLGVRMVSMDHFHHGTSDTGSIEMMTMNYNIGNGVDPIDVKGLGYMFGYGAANANVNISGPVQGYGFQLSVDAAATISTSTYLVGFYDNANINTASPNYTSANFSPNIDSIVNNNNYQGISLNANIGDFLGNAGYTGLGMFPNIDSFSTGSFQGIVVSPTITAGYSAVGINVDMTNATTYAGTQSTLVVQDITYTVNNPGNNNNLTVEYTDTTTAGNEVCTFSFPNIVVSIESGVSTATQVLAAVQANGTVVSNLTAVITGVASNAQVTYAQTNLAGGTDPGQKLAAQFNGDVQIQGALSFTGGLSIGALSSFATKDLATLPSGVNSIDTLITQPTLAANGTVSGLDLLGVNTAMLLTTGDNSTITTNFLGLAALGLPAVVSMGTGATIDRVGGAAFAISLDGGATGGTIDEVDLCRALALPNGITTVNKLKGYAFDLPFGDPGTTTWGFYASPTSHNYLAGDLMVGGTAGSDDVVANSSVGIELKSTVKAFLPSRMTTAERDALTAINGMVLYNTTTDKLQVYAAGSWVDLH